MYVFPILLMFAAKATSDVKALYAPFVHAVVSKVASSVFDARLSPATQSPITSGEPQVWSRASSVKSVSELLPPPQRDKTTDCTTSPSGIDEVSKLWNVSQHT